MVIKLLMVLVVWWWWSWWYEHGRYFSQFGDIFGSAFGGGGGLEAEEVNRTKGNLRIKVKLTLEEIANGVEKK
jgi:DnaJ-class molecular chaperone